MDPQFTDFQKDNSDSSTEQYFAQLVEALINSSLKNFMTKLASLGQIIMLTPGQFLQFKNLFIIETKINQKLSKEFLKNIVQKIKISPKDVQQKRDMESKEIYPILLLDPELSELRMQISQKKIPGSQNFVNETDKQDLQSFLLILKCSKKYEEMFNQIKELVIKILENSNNRFLATYFQFVEDYRQNYNQRMQETNHKNQKIDQPFKMQEILEKLKKGVHQSQLVVCPKPNLYGLTFHKKIIVNFYRCAVQFKSINNLNYQQMKLFKTISGLTLFHELADFLIKQLGFYVEDDYSFIQSQKNSYKKSYDQFKSSSEKFNFKSLKITYQDSKLIKEYKEIILEYLKTQKWQQALISTQLLKGKSLIYKYLLSKIFKLQVIGPQLDRLLSLPNKPKKSDIFHQQSQQNDPTLQVLNFSTIINIFIKQIMKQDQKLRQNFELLKSKQDFGQRIKQSFKTQLTQRQLEYILTKYSEVNIDFSKNFDTEQIEKQIQECFQQTNYSQTFQQMKLIQTYLDELIPNKIQVWSLYEIFDQIMYFNSQKFSNLLWKSKKAQNEIYFLQKLQNIHVNIAQLVNKCELFVEYVELSTILKHENRESGWIIEERLFKELHKDGSLVFSSDWDILLTLSSCVDQVECEALRSQFGAKYLSSGIPRGGLKMAANRQGSDSNARGGLSAAIPLNSCYHFQRLLRGKR